MHISKFVSAIEDIDDSDNDLNYQKHEGISQQMVGFNVREQQHHKQLQSDVEYSDNSKGCHFLICNDGGVKGYIEYHQHG